MKYWWDKRIGFIKIKRDRMARDLTHELLEVLGSTRTAGP